MKNIDLQIHTTASDGVFSSSQIIDLALKKNMQAIAITDHDTVAGIDDAIAYAELKAIDFVPGVEISCKEQGISQTIDVLGLFIDHKNPKLRNFLDKYSNARKSEKEVIVQKLNSLGYNITFEEVLSEAKGSIGRPHIAKILIRKYPGEFSSIKQVFDKLIGEGKPAYSPREKATIPEAIEAIKNAGGISILAHPGRYLNDTGEIIKKFIDAQGQGIEVSYPYNKIIGIDDSINDKFRSIAQEKNLLMSGGSDFHDLERGAEIGDAGLTDAEFKNLRSALQ